MTLADLLHNLSLARIKIGRDGSELVLRWAGDAPSPDLREGLRVHKPALLGLLQDRQPPSLLQREWLWRLGHRHLSDEQTPADWHPTGAWWWRFIGEPEWRAVPGRPGERLAPPLIPDQYRKPPETTLASTG